MRTALHGTGLATDHRAARVWWPAACVREARRRGMPPRYSSTGMPENRLEALKNLVEQNPSDSFARYGLAMAYANAGDAAQAVREYQKLLEVNPKYVAAYYHGGQTLERLGKPDEAREMYRRGVAVANEIGDQHTRSELEAVLDLLG